MTVAPLLHLDAIIIKPEYYENMSGVQMFFERA